jgi:hypothetical protein
MDCSSSRARARARNPDREDWTMGFFLSLPEQWNRSLRGKIGFAFRPQKPSRSSTSTKRGPSRNRHYLANDSGEELFQTVALRMLENLSRRTFFFDSPLVQKDNMAGNIAGETHLMSHHDHCAPL